MDGENRLISQANGFNRRNLTGHGVNSSMATLLDQMEKLVDTQRRHTRAPRVSIELPESMDAQALAAIAKPPKVRTDGSYQGEPRKRLVRPLTPGQLKFIDGLIRGKTQRQAYREAYPEDTSNDQSVSNAASALMKHPRVAKALEQAAEETIDYMLDDKGATHRWVTKQLMLSVSTCKQEGSRLKALELIGRSVGMFQASEAPAAPPVSPDELKRQLAGHMQLLVDTSPPKPITPTDP